MRIYTEWWAINNKKSAICSKLHCI
jgi:hypothetical protein